MTFLNADLLLLDLNLVELDFFDVVCVDCIELWVEIILDQGQKIRTEKVGPCLLFQGFFFFS